jgi:arabinan endo-1,5-alpha-L-arabinosidase
MKLQGMQAAGKQNWTRRGAAALAVVALISLAGCSGSSSTKALTATQVSLTESVTSVNVGGSVTLTATFNGGSGSPAAIGTIAFYDGSNYLQGVTLQQGNVVTATVPNLGIGAHSFTATYLGDQTHAPSTSSAVGLSVYDPTSLTIASNLKIAGVGDTIVLTVTANGGLSIPTGNVTFYVTSNNVTTSIGGAALSTASGPDTATLSYQIAAPTGTQTFTASLGANGYFLGSTTATGFNVTVHPPLTQDSVTLGGSLTNNASVAAGTSDTLTATILPINTAKGTPTGTVTFYDGTVALGSAPLNSAGTAATLTTKQFVTGAAGNTLTAFYSGDANYAPNYSTNSLGLTVNPYTGPTYTNPLPVTASSGTVYSCPDPAIIKSQTANVDTWYAYCGGDVLNSVDNKFHDISIYTSSDLVHWTYLRDALSALPAWVQAGTQLYTPAIKLINGVYTLYFYGTSAAGPNGPGIGYATSLTPGGPFVSPSSPLIAQSLLFTGGPSVTKYSPEIVADQSNNLWLVYGGVYGGIVINQLNSTGTGLSGGSISIGVDNYYQDPFIWYHNGYFYEFLSAGAQYLSNADANGPGLASLNVHVGRSKSITGPYDDAEGNDLNAYSTPATQFAPGGDPVLMPNGNDLQGVGSGVLFTDESGQDYMLYSGISKKQPYLPNYGGYNARQLCMDAVDWVNGWPKVRNGQGPSDYTTPQPVPAAQPGATSGYNTPFYTQDSPGTLLASYSDDFNENALNTAQWSFLHAPATYQMTGTTYSVQSVNDESVVLSGMQALPILSEPAPSGNYMIEVRVATTSSPTAFYGTNQQAGVFIYNTDTSYLRLDEFTDFDTRQIEYLDQYGPGYGASYDYQFAPVGTPNFYSFTYLRIAHRVGTGAGGSDTYTAYSSTDGVTYLQGPTWTASYGSTPKIGLFAGNTAGYTVSFDYIHVSTLLP